MQRLAGEVDRETHRRLGQQLAARTQQLDHGGDHPAIDGRHHLVTQRGGQEAVRPDGVALGIEHAQQHFVVRLRISVVDERRDHLRLEPQAVFRQRGAHVGGHVDVGETADDADVVFLEGLETVAAAILGGLAGGFGLGQRAADLAVAAVERRDAEADRQAETRIRAAVDRRVTPSRRPSPNIAASSMSDGMATAKRSPEMRAATEFGGRCLRSRSPICAIAWSPTCMPKFSLMTCNSSMSTYSRLQRCARVSASLNIELHALLERGARQQAGNGVVTGFDAGRDVAREQIGEVHVAPDELRRLEFAEQREHTRGAARSLAQRARQDAIRNRDLSGLRRDPVDDQRIAARLRDGEQLLLRAREDGDVAGLRPGERQPLVRHDDAGEHALEMSGGVGQQRLQVVRAAGLRVAAGHRQQQLEVLVARAQVFVELLDVGARQQVAAQQLERGPQVVVHVGERQHVRIDASRLHTTVTTAASHIAARRAARIDRPALRPAARSAGRRRSGRRRPGLDLRDRLQHQREQVGIGVSPRSTTAACRCCRTGTAPPRAAAASARAARTVPWSLRTTSTRDHPPNHPYDVDGVGVFPSGHHRAVRRLGRRGLPNQGRGSTGLPPCGSRNTARGAAGRPNPPSSRWCPRP